MKKFFFVYIAGGCIALFLLVYDIVKSRPDIPSAGGLMWDIIPAIIFFYLAYKAYHEKKDQELM